MTPTTYIVHDAITGHPIGLASQSLLQAHLKLKEAVPGSAPTLIASCKRICGGMEVYELDESNGTQQWPRKLAVQLIELPEPFFFGGGNWGPDPIAAPEARGFPVQFESAAEVPITPSTPWSWPALPPGHFYLNPESLTVEQLGDGWRPLCTLDERYPIDHEGKFGATWVLMSPDPDRPEHSSFTYRTRAPIPTLQ